MSMMELLRFNPWWENKKRIYEDHHIAEFSRQTIQYHPEWELRKGIQIIRGPRQVGKTTLIKLKIKELIEKGTATQDLFYYSFDLAKKNEDIYQTVLEYLETNKESPKKFLFLDEIGTAPDWAKAIKLLVDRGDITKNDCVVATGSSAIDLKNGGERLPGRGIEGNEYYYHPCSFQTYLKLHQIDIKIANWTNETEFYKTAKSQINQLLVINNHFRKYLETGGFLYAMNHGKNDATMERYTRWIEGDFSKQGKNTQIAKEIMTAIIKKQTSQISYNSIKKETSAASHNTIIDYLETLQDELIIQIIPKSEWPFKIQPKKEKKICFLDPLLSAIGEKWGEVKQEEATKVEQTVQSQLSRIGKIAFYNDGKKEIDCLLKKGEKTIGIEIKWSNNINEKDVQSIHQITKKGYLLSKETIGEKKGIPIIPTALFLAMIENKELTRRKPLDE